MGSLSIQTPVAGAFTGGISCGRCSHSWLARADARPCRQQASGQSRREHVLLLLLSGPSVRSSPSLPRGAGDHRLWKAPVGLGCPLRSLLRPRSVLTSQMPTAFCPPAPVAQPPASGLRVHPARASLPAHQKESPPRKAREHSRLPQRGGCASHTRKSSFCVLSSHSPVTTMRIAT